MFAKGSRYENVPEAIYEAPSGRQVRYKRLRILPDPTAIQLYRVAAADRLDLIAFRFYRDGKANDALLPDDLLAEIGRQLRIPLPER